METVGGLFVPIAIAALVIISLIVIAKFIKNNYLRIPPSRVAVISGRRHKRMAYDTDGEHEVIVGYRIVKGGAAFVLPLLERVDYLDLTEITIPQLEVKDAITKHGAPLTVKAVANIKIGSEEILLSNAVERLLGKTTDEIKKMAYETLEGHLRSMLGTLTIEEVNSDRALFSQKMITESQTDLAKLGLKIDVLTVKELSDTQGYLEALGKKRTSEVKRDAAVGSAQAEREATINATTAKKEAEVVRQGNIAQEAEADKERKVKIAQYEAETNAEQAKAAQAGPLATAEARKMVVERETEVELAKTRKMTEVAEAEAERKEKELLATEVKPAEAKKLAAIAEAEGKAKAVEIEAKASKAKKTLEGEGDAAAIRAKMLAEADGIKAKLEAEAVGVLKKAEAYKQLNESGKLLQILEALQVLVPNAIEKLAPVMEAIAKPMSNIDKVVMIDTGGNGNNGSSSSLQRFMSTAPGALLGIMEQAKAAGFDLSGLLAKAGVKTADETATSGDKIIEVSKSDSA